MARLRREEEARAYERMLNPPLVPETFAQRFPNSAFAYSKSSDTNSEDEEVSYQEVHRQIILIINVIVSVIACSVFIWVAARHWSPAKRLGLSMGGSGVVAIAEAVVYSGYIRRVKEAKATEKKKPEIKEIVQSWIIDGASTQSVTLSSQSNQTSDEGFRHRKGKHR